MNHKLKFVAIYLTVLIIILSSICVILYSMYVQNLYQEKISHLLNQAQVLSKVSLYYLEDEKGIESFTREWSAGLGFPVIVVKGNNNKHTSIYEGTDLLNTRELVRAFQGIISYDIRYNTFLNSKTIFVASPIFDIDDYLVGAIQIVFPVKKLQPQIELFKQAMYRVFFIGLLLAILIYVVIGSVYQKYFEKYKNTIKAIIVENKKEGIASLEKVFFERADTSIYQTYKMVENLRNSLYNEKVKFDTLLNKLKIGIIVTDINRNVLFINNEAEKMLGIVGEISIGMSLIKVSRDFKIDELTQFTIIKQTENIDIIDKYGKERKYLKIITSPISDGVLIVLQDLTESKNVENMRRDFISNVSHELRTPLASIKVLVENMIEGAIENYQLSLDFLNRIESEVDKLTQLVNELSELSRLESGNVKFDFTWLNAGEVIKRTVERMKPMSERANISLGFNLPEDLPLVWGDDAQLELVLVNLIHNAIKFTTSGGSVLINAYSDDSFTFFSVVDTGVGIPQEDLSRIFERFYKVDRSRSGEGTGLGLAIARHIIHSHGGKIWAHSEEGKGSIFTFTLKRSKN
ncbi:MAG: Alkaline phosphatase synthesis sensor protein PhoR [candidate division WS2 bacterium]|uniref:histidine kinase n=1 Tax=Psychracetigena formicireducens TaxID=2986056 RepID=A0A9E2BIS5_PSYF1|nr:Alkaline phosphatase synthesis sensor protein PhoR [Candidatus Psychracetigena formicireducens]MBT9145687.1 Alkaline phosphatase synthesis sensor protein PhoR [Candidatus Psychracetigena formicireducens]